MVQFLHMPPPSGPAGDFARALVVSHAVEFEALSDTEFMLGSAVPHDHELVLGNYSVHTSPKALREANVQISAIGRKRDHELLT